MKTIRCFTCHRHWTTVPTRGAIGRMVRAFTAHRCTPPKSGVAARYTRRPDGQITASAKTDVTDQLAEIIRDYELGPDGTFARKAAAE